MIADELVARISAHRETPGHPLACRECTQWAGLFIVDTSARTRYRHIVAFEVPLPPAELSPNERPHWSKRNKAAQSYKAIVWGACLEALGTRRPLVAKARICLTFRTTGAPSGLYAPDDPDNAVAAFKYGIDGIRLTGIFPDDDHRHLELGTGEIRREKPAGVDVMILEVL